ncbi:hypothetical protein [Ruegeria lacuscaerulensis]|uniref:hypothetical protein n=1 Tax=Ruegeria lacuscaerulensis TaxID=55218 RepID=UPI001481C123|nr:hypothetical protein [Ruegeria lacuscaerulensis]
MTVKDLLEAKGKRTINYVQVAREKEAIAAREAGIDIVGSAFVPEQGHSAKAVPDTHFQFGLPWGIPADVTEALRDAMAAMMAGAQSVYCGYNPWVVEALAHHGVPAICNVGLARPRQLGRAGSRRWARRWNKPR